MQALSDFDCHDIRDWVVANNYKAPIIAILLYLIFVYTVPGLLKNRTALPIRHYFALWNFFLAIFSLFGAINVIPFTLRMYREKGLRHMVCSDDAMMGLPRGREDVACYREIGVFMTAFMLSKFPELLDTVFLIGLKKPVIFLHWWHHFTVLGYSWFAYVWATPTAITFCTMNYTVHTVMYAYFGLAIYTKKLNKYGIFITMMQLAQMAVGLVLTVLSFYFGVLQGKCSSAYSDSLYYPLCTAMYGSYFYLFYRLLVAKGKGQSTKME